MFMATTKNEYSESVTIPLKSSFLSSFLINALLKNFKKIAKIKIKHIFLIYFTCLIVLKNRKFIIAVK